MRTVILFFTLLCVGQVLLAQNATDSLLIKRLQPNAESPLKAISIYLENAKTGKVYETAVGENSNGEAVSAKDAFKIASSTKLFVATLIMQLNEANKLELNDQVSNYITIDSLSIFEGKDYTKQITITQLLNHRSGLANLFTDKKDEFAGVVFQNPQKQYSAQELVSLFYDLGLAEMAHFKPDEGWYYSDMNYVLLGLLIEKLEQKTLAEVLRQRIIEPLKMKATYFEFYETPILNQKRVPQFVTEYDFNAINTSFDWAGGGLVSTHQDLATFMKGLFSGQLISNKSLEALIDVKPTNATSLPYGYGVYESSYNGQKFYGHYGFYGTYVGYCPETQTVLSYCFGQSQLSFNKDQVANDVLVEFQTSKN